MLGKLEIQINQTAINNDDVYDPYVRKWRERTQNEWSIRVSLVVTPKHPEISPFVWSWRSTAYYTLEEYLKLRPLFMDLAFYEDDTHTFQFTETKRMEKLLEQMHQEKQDG